MCQQLRQRVASGCREYIAADEDDGQRDARIGCFCTNSSSLRLQAAICAGQADCNILGKLLGILRIYVVCRRWRLSFGTIVTSRWSCNALSQVTERFEEGQ